MAQPVHYPVIGLMSGTSLDGLDIVYARFTHHKNQWTYEILAAETYAYPVELIKILEELGTKSALNFVQVDIDLGRFFANKVNLFIKRHHCKPLLIASHGHTIFHRPERGFSTQIGHGPTIAGLTGLPVINDFRSADVALEGQGAPLVPIGDRLLFPDYHFCLNLGGIANISFEHQNKRVAFDISACNIILNHLANKLEQPFDNGGELAREGRQEQELIDELNALPYFERPFPKSLGREWVDEAMLPLIEAYDGRVRDKLNTCCHHIAQQIALAIRRAEPQAISKKGFKCRMLITGGGAYNKFLVEQINSYNPSLNITVPDSRLISFKEALIFGFLGVLRWRGEINVLRSVTGARRDSSGGALHNP